MFILTENIDEGVVRVWHFQVNSQLEMAQFIVNHLEQFDGSGMFGGITWRSGLEQWRTGEVTVKGLLEAIKTSHVDGDSVSGFQIHHLDLSQNGAIATDVTYSSS
jgi:hypothetical protein